MEEDLGSWAAQEWVNGWEWYSGGVSSYTGGGCEEEGGCSLAFRGGRGGGIGERRGGGTPGR